MRRLAFPLLALVAAGCPPPVDPPTPLQLSGEGWTLRLEGDTYFYARGDQPLVTLGKDAFQLGTVGQYDDNASYDPYWLLVNDGVFTPTQPTGFAWRTAAEALSTGDAQQLDLSLTYNRNLSAHVTAQKSDDGSLRFLFLPSGTSNVAVMRVKLTVDGAEGFYGLGEWFDGLNHRGKLRPMQLEPDLNSESAATENHVSVPFLVGSRGWGVFFEVQRHGVLDVAKSEPAAIDALFGTAEESSQGLTFHLFSSPAPLDVVGQYWARSGVPAAPADWAMGPWLWRDESRDQAEVEDDVRQLRALDLATSGLWIDRPYATEVNTFDFNAAQFPDAGGMVDTIHAAGLRLALWHTPYVAAGAEPFRAEALARGYFPPTTGAQLNRWSPPLDTRKSGARAWWTQNVKRYVDLGVEGFKLDFAEDVVAGVSGRRSNWVFADGATDRSMTDRYPREYHDLYRAALGTNPGFLLVRHARWGEQTRGVIVWPGDIDATLTKFGEVFVDRGGDSRVGVGGLPSAIRAGIGLAASGFPYFASDTGGYRHSPPDKETFIRWVEHSALMPVMQTGDSSSQPPWLYTPENGRDAEALEVYRRFARLHLRLFPFLKTGTLQHARPFVRAFGLQFPEYGLHPEDQYCLGDELLVAPVETKGQASRALVKPPGEWFDFDDGTPLGGAAGERVTVAAPLTKLPLYLRAGALIPLLEPAMDTLAPATDPGVRSFADDAGALWVRVQPSDASTSFTVFDGTQLSQRGGVLSASPGSLFKSTVVWELRGVTTGVITHAGQPVPAVADEAALEAVSLGFVTASGRILIKTPLDNQPTTTR
jgi:alpha-D-xyloside xylohydrolase